jgi:hypothetical protein
MDKYYIPQNKRRTMFSITNALPANPVGQAQQLASVNTYIQEVIAEWNAIQTTSVSWWKIWKRVSIESLQVASKFLLQALDDLIVIVDKELDSGPDKKATVLSAVSNIYDFVVAEALPVWLKPFAGSVKNYIVYSLVSSAIDFIVTKYRTGSWRDTVGVPKDTTPNTVVAPPTT